MGSQVFQGTKHSQVEGSRDGKMLERGSTDDIRSTEAQRDEEKSCSLHPPQLVSSKL